jgi:hypothetical protein
MICRLARHPASTQPATVGNVYLASNNRLYAPFASLVVKSNSGEEISVFCNRHGRHLPLLDLIKKFTDTTRTIK